jgi:hypothetical protein
LRPALFCGRSLLPTLNYRTANFPCVAAPSCVVERPAALFHFSAQPKPSIFGWLFITNMLLVKKWRAWSVRPAPPAQHVAALLLLSLPCLTSRTDIYVPRALYRVRAQLQHPHGPHGAFSTISVFCHKQTPSGLHQKWASGVFCARLLITGSVLIHLPCLHVGAPSVSSLPP